MTKISKFNLAFAILVTLSGCATPNAATYSGTAQMVVLSNIELLREKSIAVGQYIRTAVVGEDLPVWRPLMQPGPVVPETVVVETQTNALVPDMQAMLTDDPDDVELFSVAPGEGKGGLTLSRDLPGQTTAPTNPVKSSRPAAAGTPPDVKKYY